MKRRSFLRNTGAAAVAAGAGLTGAAPSSLFGAGARPTPNLEHDLRPPKRQLRILILGGTGFIGPPQVRYALDRGHEVTLFNRGRTNPELFSEVETLIGDRAASDYASLAGRTWDVVIDNSSSNPDWVEDSANLLKDQAEQYLFISTRSVYAGFDRVPMTVDAPVYTPENTEVPEGGRLPYGLAKVLCERAAIAAFGEDRTTIVRPSLIVGPGDPTDRFTHWPVRIHRGGEILSPGDGTDRVQVIDARDVSEWVIRLLENGTTGTYMALGPRNGRSMAEVLYGIAAVVTTDLEWTWVDTDFLLESGVRPYSDLPVWIPTRGDRVGFARFDLTREIEAGLTFRSLADTTSETLEWFLSLPADRTAELRTGLSPNREAEVLRAWHQVGG